jgi:hypothetical protein
MTNAPPPLPRKIRVAEAMQMARWSERTFYRYMPYFKTYLLIRPGKKTGTRLVDYEDFCRFIERHAQGPTNLL